jgi:hypothetical protein
VARMGEGRGVYMVLVWRPEGKRPLGRPRRSWEDNWIRLAQDRVQWQAFVNTLVNRGVP